MWLVGIAAFPYNRHLASRGRAVHHRTVRQSTRPLQPVPRARCIPMAHFSHLQRVDRPAAHRIVMLAGQQKLDLQPSLRLVLDASVHIFGTLSECEPYRLATQRKRTTLMTCTIALLRGAPLGTFSTWASKSSILKTEFSSRALGSCRTQCLARRKPTISLRSPCGGDLASISACITKYFLNTLAMCDIYGRQLQTPPVPTQSHPGTNRHTNCMIRNMQLLIPAHGISGFPIINPPQPPCP
jgi:hypothetical protein